MARLKHWPLGELLLLACTLCLVVVLEEVAGVTRSWKFNVCTMLWVSAILAPRFIAKRREAIALWGMFGLLLGSLQFIDLSAAGAFRNLQHDISIGMGVQEIHRLYVHHFPPGGRFRQPELSMIPWPYNRDEPNVWEHFEKNPNSPMTFVLDPTDGAYNSELLIVHRRAGRVVSTEYLPD